MRLGCVKCNKMLGDDTNANLYIIASSELDISKFRIKPRLNIQIKCNRCAQFNSIFGGTS